MYSQNYTVLCGVCLRLPSLLVPAQNALRIVRKYVLEFFQPLAAPPNNRKSSKPTQTCPDGTLAGRMRQRRFQKTNNELKRLQWGQVMGTARYRARRRGNNKIAPTRGRRRSRTVWDHGDSGTQRMSSIGGDSAELRRNAGQRTRETETAKRHQTRHWRDSRDVGDFRTQRARQNGGD